MAGRQAGVVTGSFPFIRRVYCQCGGWWRGQRARSVRGGRPRRCSQPRAPAPRARCTLHAASLYAPHTRAQPSLAAFRNYSAYIPLHKTNLTCTEQEPPPLQCTGTASTNQGTDRSIIRFSALADRWILQLCLRAVARAQARKLCMSRVRTFHSVSTYVYLLVTTYSIRYASRLFVYIHCVVVASLHSSDQ